MSDLIADGIGICLLSREQMAAYYDGHPGWTLRVLDRLRTPQIDLCGKVVIFTEDGRDLEFTEVGHA